MIGVLRNATLSHWVKGSRRFERTRCLHSQGNDYSSCVGHLGVSTFIRNVGERPTQRPSVTSLKSGILIYLSVRISEPAKLNPDGSEVINKDANRKHRTAYCD